MINFSGLTQPSFQVPLTAAWILTMVAAIRAEKTEPKRMALPVRVTKR